MDDSADDPRRRGHRGAFGAADPEGADWIEPTVQIGPAALGVAAVDRAKVRH
ncbi:hypothetical protein HEP84_46105 [Streptomyces sp. RLB1-33]|nr:hypothetical protein [Streptomyces sp. RLB1-33]QIY75334.1 hypothetical protein HEP84_46105 [Streptomyces sp. RLB1-33]